jgi:hypothetical protein
MGPELRVGHWPWSLQGTLQEMYLDPLQKRVDETGSPHGNGEPFTLWIDIKVNAPWLPDMLVDVLEGYSILTVFSEGRVDYWYPKRQVAD